MSELKPCKIEVTKGAPIVNDAWIHAESDRVVAISVDLKSKYCEYSGSFGERGIDGIIISPRKDSLYLDGRRKGKETIVMFPEYKGWSLWSCNVSRYSAYVCLVKD